MNTVPFLTTEGAWYWALAVHDFKTNPKGAALYRKWAKFERPCEHADILREAARLGLHQMAMKTLVAYGRTGKAPNRKAPEEDRRIWDAAMDLLGTRLREKGIVVAAIDWDGAERSA